MEYNVFEKLDEFREKLGDDVILDELKYQLSTQKLEEFVKYIEKKYKRFIED